MEIHSVRLDHGSVQPTTMSYTQRQTQNHRPSHGNQAQSDLYKPARSPITSAAASIRYPYPSSPQLQQQQQQQPQQQAPAPQLLQQQRYNPGQSPVFVRDYRDAQRQRISLLHSEYGHSRGTHIMHVQDMQGSGQQPLKKIRLQDHKDSVTPLRIDTREQPGAYNPQVEAISPILPDINQQEDQAFRTTKDQLIQQIGKVDREIAKAESQISILKKKEQELEEVANKPSVKAEETEDLQPTHQSLPQKIYAENRKKAQTAHGKLETLGPKLDWPLYNQPTDSSVYDENIRKHAAFKRRLLEYFKKRHTEKETRNSYLTDTYSKLMQEWLRKVDKIESSTKRKTKEAKNREFFEKVFPELRKQREDKERFNRVGARVKSEADMEEIMDNLQEQALEDKKMRSYAVIPPILLDAKEKKISYNNNNGHIDNMETVYKSRQFLNIWTPSEKEIFKEKYLQHPKNFGVISSYLDRKSVSDCVQYYYHTKKTENYKQLLKRTRQRTRASKNNTQKVNSSVNTSVVDILTTGVTTRLQREQQQKTVVQQTREPGSELATSSVQQTTGSVTTTTTVINSSTASVTSPSSAAASASPTSNTTSIATSTSLTVTNSASPSNNGSCASTNRSPLTATDTNTQNNVTNNDNSASSGVVISASNSISTGTTTITVISSSSSNNAPSSVLTLSSSSSVLITTPSVLSSTNNVSSVKSPNNNSTILESSNSNEQSNINKTFNSEVNNTSVFDNEYTRSKIGIFDDANKENNADGIKASVTPDPFLQIKKETESPQEFNSDQNMTSSTVTENKKKKERRKEQDNTAMETSDDECSDVQDKIIQGNCIVCNVQLGPQMLSRPLAPSQASQYGLREEQIPPNGRVCNTCRCKCVRSRSTHCPLPNCPNSRGRVKRLRSFPQRLQDLPNDVRETLLSEFHIPSGVTKCCSACFNRIQRRLGPVEEWPEEDINHLKAALTEIGANWQLIGERLNKPPHQIRSFYAYNRKRMNLESCLGDRKPTLTDEEESGSSTSSCEEPIRGRHSSDTASAESPPVIQGQNQITIKKEDYDSSATETADEAQTPDHYQGSATITPVTNDGQPHQNASPLSVKDLVLNVIELSLKKNSGGQQLQQNPPTSGVTPTISSILNNDSNEVTIVSEYNLNSQPRQQQRNDLAKLVTPLIGATITPVPIPQNQQQPVIPEQLQNARDDLVILQVQDGRGTEPETLDLSLKKPRELPPPAHAKHQQQIQQHRSEPAYMYHPERKSPAFTQIRVQSKLPSPKPANPKAGSITLGTPIITQQNRYEGILRQMPPETKMGSITQGTPIHMPQHMQEKRVYDYFKRGQVQQNVSQNAAPPQSAYPQGGYRQPAYTVEQQLSSRQIIMNDYITSQQMLNRRNEKAQQYYPASSPHRTPPPPQQQNQQRQGVIQRHTRPYYPPGHEAFSSLVDVAVQQPSLPVPTQPHEGLGKTMADNILEQPHRFQIMQQQQAHMRQVQRMEEQKRQAAYMQHQQQQARQQTPRCDSSTLTAASLIDAIITHQINQTAEGGREVVSNAREPPKASDLLFQNFHRDPPQSQDNNGERPSSVISVDLDSDSINKNLTVKELTDSVISHDFSSRQSNAYFHMENEQWKRRLAAQQQQQQHQQKVIKDDTRSITPQQQQQQSQQDERQIIRIAQPQQKYHVEPVSPPENNHWPGADQNYRRYPQPQKHINALDYVKNRIVEVMRTEDDKKDNQQDPTHSQDKDRSNSPGEMVIDEEKHENDFVGQNQVVTQQQQQSSYSYPYVSKDNTANVNDSSRNNEPKPLLSAQYEPLSDED